MTSFEGWNKNKCCNCEFFDYNHKFCYKHYSTVEFQNCCDRYKRAKEIVDNGNFSE